MASLQAASVNSRMLHGAVDGTTRALKVVGSILGSAPGTEACRVTVFACTRVVAVMHGSFAAWTRSVRFFLSVNCIEY